MLGKKKEKQKIKTPPPPPPPPQQTNKTKNTTATTTITTTTTTTTHTHKITTKNNNNKEPLFVEALYLNLEDLKQSKSDGWEGGGGGGEIYSLKNMLGAFALGESDCWPTMFNSQQRVIKNLTLMDPVILLCHVIFLSITASNDSELSEVESEV